MPRVIPTSKVNGALIKIERQKSSEHGAGLSGEESQLIKAILQQLPQMIASAIKTPVVHVGSPNVTVDLPKHEQKQPYVSVNVPEIKIPQAPAVNIPPGKAPIVHVEAPVVNLTIRRPNKWHFTFERDEYGYIISAECEDISTPQK
jgi:hypothetical protein